jgi:hypothetical protein
LPVTITDVAREAQVSRATVSRVISHNAITSENVKTRVLAAIEKLGYQPNLVARSLRVQSSKIIGLIISDIQNPFYTGLVRAVEDTAYKNNFLVFLCNADEDIEKEVLYLKLMIAEKVAGVVITPTQEYNNPSRILLEAGIPVVAVDRIIQDLDVDSVVIDNFKMVTGGSPSSPAHPPSPPAASAWKDTTRPWSTTAWWLNPGSFARAPPRKNLVMMRCATCWKWCSLPPHCSWSTIS